MPGSSPASSRSRRRLAMSSHREAPEISKDPVADNTDLYAFVDPKDPSKVTIIANYIPLEEPAGGPNFFQFGDDVLYEIKIDNDGDAQADVTYQFRFKPRITNPETFLYNTGPIMSLTSPLWNVRQTYTVTRVTREEEADDREFRVLGSDLISPPVRIGPRSTPGYAALANAAIHSLSGGVKVFAGQRDEGFYVDLGSIFDLGALRPFQNLHLIPLPATGGRDGTKGYNVHSIAIQVPKTDLTRDGSMPTNVMDAKSVIGVWATASRQRDDLVAVLATGTPAGVVPGFQNFTGPRIADMLRLNMAVPPAASPNTIGLIAGDAAGFPNGRRVADNVVAIELRAVAGIILPLVRPTYTVDGAAALLTDGTTNAEGYLSTFPYLAHPNEGFEHSHD